jgi:hypothetical protein
MFWRNMQPPLWGYLLCSEPSSFILKKWALSKYRLVNKNGSMTAVSAVMDIIHVCIQTRFLPTHLEEYDNTVNLCAVLGLHSSEN